MLECMPLAFNKNKLLNMHCKINQKFEMAKLVTNLQNFEVE